MDVLLNSKSAYLSAIVAFTVVTFPAVLRLFSSPLLFVLILPLIFLLLCCTILCFSLFLGNFVDKQDIPRSDVLRISRPFAFSTPAAWEAVLTRSQWSQNAPRSLPQLCPNSLHLSSALDEVLNLIIRDFVLTWYNDLSPSPSFPVAVFSLLHEATKRIFDRANGVDWAALVVRRIIPKITLHIEQYRKSEVALRGAKLERKLTQSDELDLLLASRYSSKGTSKLHPAIDNLSTTFTKQTEEAHLRQLVEKALPYILPEAEVHSDVLRLVVREIVVCIVLQPVMDMIADPDFWNRSIDQVAGAAIQQQKLITKVRSILEAQSPRRRPLSQNPSSLTSELITIRTNTPQFESFLRSINRCSSLLDARRLKNDIMGEIRRTRLLLANHENDDWINDERTEDVVAFLDRLYTAKRKVEQRITLLGGMEDHGTRHSMIQEHHKESTLRDILGNPSSLSYFMEFMDRRRRSLLVQFWLTVESFKNPLESIDSGTSEDEEDDGVQDKSTSSTLKEDISMINDLYFSRSVHPLLTSISAKYIDMIRAFAESRLSVSVAEERRVRRCVMLAQKQVEQVMEQDFESFQRSELWFRAVGDTDFGKQGGAEQDSQQLSKAKDNTIVRYPTSAEGLGHGVQSHRSSVIPETTVRPRTDNFEVLLPRSDSSSNVTRPPLFDDSGEQQREEEQRMEAIKAALTGIMLEEQVDKPSKRASSRTERSLTATGPRRERKLAMADDESEDDVEDNQDTTDSLSVRSYQPAGPGDLQLSYEITRLGEKIANLDAQAVMLDSLIKKAELTGDNQELRLLVKSRSSMARDLRELKFQKRQYEQQESANRLVPDRTRVSILNSTVGDEDGKSVVRYLVEIKQLASDGNHASGWVVARRYNEFFNLHNKLRERYAPVRNLDFPGKRLVTALSSSFLDSRRIGLEKYLQNVIAIPVVCESDELRSFLSRDSPFVASNSQSISESPSFSGIRNVYRSVAESIDDMFFGPSMLDVMIQRLTRQAAEFAGIVGTAINDEDLVVQALNITGKSSPDASLMQLSGDLKPIEGETSTSVFSAPICDLISAVFELDKKNNWLRRQAIVIILQQVLGGAIERKFRENVKSLLEEPRLLSLVRGFRDAFWPDGKLRPPTVPHTTEEKMRTRDEANRKLSSLVPDLAANMIGRSNARRGARRMFAVLQNRRLNQHITYTVVDDIFAALFPQPEAGLQVS